MYRVTDVHNKFIKEFTDLESAKIFADSRSVNSLVWSKDSRPGLHGDALPFRVYDPEGKKVHVANASF